VKSMRAKLNILFIGKLYLPEVFGDLRFKEESPAGKRRILGLLGGLIKLGAKVRCISPILSYYSGKVHRKKKVDVRGMDIIYPFVLSYKIINYLSLIFSTIWIGLKESARCRPDVILCYNPTIQNGIPAYLISRCLNIPLVIDYQDYQNSEIHSKRWVRLVYGTIESFLIKRVDGAILASSTFEDLFNKNKKKQKLTVIRSGISINDFETISTQLGHLDNIIVYAGRLDEVRGLDVLIEAVRHMKNQDYSLWVMGKGPLENQIRNVSETSNGKIRYLGFVKDEDYLSMMGQALICVNPQKEKFVFSRYCFPSKLFEYMAMGRFVVSSNISDVAIVFPDEVFIYHNDDPNHLAEVLDFIIDHKHSLHSMPENAKNRIMKEENWEMVGERAYEFLLTFK
jgi:glycosyltransferase involved in cell wall biosynthesis